MKRGLQQIWVVGYFDMAQIGYFHTALYSDFNRLQQGQLCLKIQVTDVTLLPLESALNIRVFGADFEWSRVCIPTPAIFGGKSVTFFHYITAVNKAIFCQKNYRLPIPKETVRR